MSLATHAPTLVGLALIAAAFLLALPGLIVRLSKPQPEPVERPDLAANVAAFDSMPKEALR